MNRQYSGRNIGTSVEEIGTTLKGSFEMNFEYTRHIGYEREKGNERKEI